MFGVVDEQIAFDRYRGADLRDLRVEVAEPRALRVAVRLDPRGFLAQIRRRLRLLDERQ